jgi:hypothetical protein
MENPDRGFLITQKQNISASFVPFAPITNKESDHLIHRIGSLSFFDTDVAPKSVAERNIADIMDIARIYLLNLRSASRK